MYYLYIKRGFDGGADRRKQTEALVLRCLEDFLEETEAAAAGSREIIRGPHGKPGFKELPVEFSVSHTGNIWACLMSYGSGPVGLDIQEIREYSYEKIAARYFTESEQEEIAGSDPKGFFAVWTRKEAYAKYTGKGLNSGLKDIDTLAEGSLQYIPLRIEDGIAGACCVEEKGELCIKTVM